MSAAALPAPPGLPLARLAPAGVGLLALAGWAALAFDAPAPAFQGWLIAFALWSAPSVGALHLLLIERLTGGRWGEAFAAELAPAAQATPVLLLLAAPLPFGLAALYPWAARPEAVDASVRAWLLNPVAYTLVGGSALVGWSLLALRRHRFGRLGAGLGLGFTGLAVSVVAPMAVVSVELGVTNSAAGMTLAMVQLTAALGWAALQGADRPAKRPAGDLGGLLFATALGLTYLVFMAWLVAWYADRPGLNRWWGPRTAAPWGYVVGLAFAAGLLAPASLLALRRRIGVRRALLAAGACVWAGLALYAIWLFAPSYGLGCLLPAALAAGAQGGLWLAAAGGAPRAAERLDG